MNKFLTLRLNRFVPFGLMAAAAVALLAPAPANATPYVIKLVQQGSNVVATGGGSIDLTGLTNVSPGSGGSEGFINASQGYIAIGSGSSVDDYSGFMGPASFGSGTGFTTTPNNSGDLVGMAGSSGAINFIALFVPSGYLSDTALSGTATWGNASFASLGVTPGTYVWTWGTGADQSFTLDIGATTVPEPAVLGTFGLGLLLLGAFVSRRRRTA